MHLWTQSKGCMYRGMLQSKGKALLEEGMEIPEERASLSSPYTPRFHSQTPVARCSNPPGPLCCGNYCSSLGKWDLHLCCNYSRTSTAKGSKGAGEAAMGSLPSQQQAHSEDHSSCKQPAQPQPCSHTLTHPQTLTFPSIRGVPGHSRSHRWPPGTACRKPPIPVPKSLPSPIPVCRTSCRFAQRCHPNPAQLGGVLLLSGGSPTRESLTQR